MSPAMGSVLLIDFEAHQHGDEPFHVKELCVISASQPLKPLYYLFKSKQSWSSLSIQQKRTYCYQEHHLHHLAWNEGNERYCANCLFEDIIERFPLATLPEAKCYVIGKQKADFLQEQLPQLNIYEYANSFKDVPNDAPSHLTCSYRNHSRDHCATLKCYRMYEQYCLNKF